ncbi:DUF6300 family protein [Streptomyces sp. NPDC053493]|uniref:DUF6300 family protein n=1 Tax=Streptomyces sp. NPDC053493 TaxID=3365705 RepID=UPI0037D3496F
MTRLPQCSLCHGDLIMSVVMPESDAESWPLRLELCAACDSGDVARPAAGILLQFFADGAGRDEARAEEAAFLVLAWMRECMAAHRPGPGRDRD